MLCNLRRIQCQLYVCSERHNRKHIWMVLAFSRHVCIVSQYHFFLRPTSNSAMQNIIARSYNITNNFIGSGLCSPYDGTPFFEEQFNVPKYFINLCYYRTDVLGTCSADSDPDYRRFCPCTNGKKLWKI